LLKERSWLDIPVVRHQRRRAILALEKARPANAFAEVTGMGTVATDRRLAMHRALGFPDFKGLHDIADWVQYSFDVGITVTPVDDERVECDRSPPSDASFRR
jgi:hypothetical protein